MARIDDPLNLNLNLDGLSLGGLSVALPTVDNPLDAYLRATQPAAQIPTAQDAAMAQAAPVAGAKSDTPLAGLVAGLYAGDAAARADNAALRGALGGAQDTMPYNPSQGGQYQGSPYDTMPYAPSAPPVDPRAAQTPLSSAGAQVTPYTNGDAYGARLAQVESGGRANAKAPTSSAAGLYQFTRGTALQYKNRLGYGGMSNEEYLKLRYNPQVAARMEQALRSDNTAYLRKRNLPTDNGALYLAHFLGAGGAGKTLRANRNAPIASVMSAAQIKANKSIRFRGRTLPNMTAGDLVDWARYKFRSTN